MQWDDATAADAMDRLRRLEDREALHELIVRYCLAVDNRDFEALVDLFTEDGGFGTARGIVAQGREEVKRYYSARLGEYDGPTFHYPHGQTLEFLGPDEARGIVPSHAEHGLDGNLIVAGIRYHDEYVRDEGRWRFRVRSIRFQYFMDARSLLTNYSDRLRLRRQDPPMPADYPEPLETWQRFRAEVDARRAGLA